jgi:hypothetical protein
MRVIEDEWLPAIDLALRIKDEAALVERRATASGSVLRHYLVGAQPVVIEIATDGTVSCLCLCVAGIHGQTCPHAAKALCRAGYLRPPVTPEARARGRAALRLLNDEDEDAA